jgi:poly(hydroxyalkanoate) granule-associated protein
MVRKVTKPAAKASSKKISPVAMAENIKASAQQIYLAGLAQFGKAQQEGGKVFEGLVKEGLAIQRRTQSAAEERITEVTSKASGMANEVAAKATGQWNKLEDIFEDRVARALNKMGVPTAKDIQTLIARVDALAQKTGKAAAKPVMAQARAAAKTVKAKAVTPAKKAVKRAVKTAPKTA